MKEVILKKVKIIIKKIFKNKESNLVGKRGSELAQTVLITAIMVVIIATLFFPQIQSLFSNSMEKLSGWFDSILNNL